MSRCSARWDWCSSLAFVNCLMLVPHETLFRYLKHQHILEGLGTSLVRYIIGQTSVLPRWTVDCRLYALDALDECIWEVWAHVAGQCVIPAPVTKSDNHVRNYIFGRFEIFYILDYNW